LSASRFSIANKNGECVNYVNVGTKQKSGM
jgi:hypothetical protein